MGAATVLVALVAVVVMVKMMVYFIKTIFNYPTLAECYKVAALDAYNKLLIMLLPVNQS